MTNKPEFVLGTDTKDRVDRAISLPTMLSAPDGRVFDVQSWEPCVSMESVVSVRIEAIIRMEQQ